MVVHQSSAIVGRDRELERLREALDQAIHGRAGLVVIGGEAGIGKTALVGALAAEARDLDVAVFTGYCDEFDMVPPYGPWLDSGLLDVGNAEPPIPQSALTPERQRILEFLQHHGAARPADVARELDISPNAAAQTLRRMFGDGLLERPRYGYYCAGAEVASGSQTSHTGGHGHSSMSVLEGTEDRQGDVPAWSPNIISRLQALSTESAVLVVLEDVHWSDEASLALVSSVTQQLASAPVLVVMTYREDEMLASRTLAHYLPGLLRRPRATSLQLRRLEAPAVRDLVAQRYGLTAQDESRMAGYLHQYAEGNPFFTEELLRTLEQDEILRRTVFGWSLADLPHFHVPPVLRQLIEAQIGLLDEADRHLLQIAAMIGVEISYDLWLAISDVSDDELADVVERAMQARLIVETADRAGLRFRHALIRETLYDGVVLPRRRAWHRQIGEALAAQPEVDPEAVAHHFTQAGDQRVVDWLIRAGRRSARASAYSTACSLLERALTILARDDERSEVRAWLLCEMAEYYRFIDHARGLTHLDAAQIIADRTGDDALRVVVMACRGRIWGAHGSQSLGEIRGALAMFNGLSEADRERALQSRVGYLLRGGTFGQWLVHYGHFAEALPILEQAAASSNPSGTSAEIYETASAYFGLGIAHSALGEPEQAQRDYAMARAHFRSLGIAHLVRVTLSWELETVYVDYHADRPAERQALLREYTESQQGADFQATLATGATLLDGNWDAIRSGIEAQRHVDALRIYFARLLAELDRLQGNWAQAWSHISSTVPGGPNTQPTTYQFHNILELLKVAASLALDQGNLGSGQRWNQALERWLQWSGKVSGRPTPHLLWSRYHLLAGDPDKAREHALAAYQLAVHPRQALALLQSQRALGTIDTLCRRFDDAGRHMQAALELAVACAAPHEQALTLLAQARLEHALEREEAAAHALDEVDTICAPLDARPLLAEAAALRQSLDSRRLDAGLSARELEVLRLVAEGLTDREAAERLYLSPRTVNQHLRSIYNKLGVNSRTAATRMALERNLV